MRQPGAEHATRAFGEGRCDRADALVWALDDLVVRPRVVPGVMRL